MIISNYYEMNKSSFRFSGYRRTRQRGGGGDSFGRNSNF